MMSRKERKLDRLKKESEGARKEAPRPTCAVPMHAPQTSSQRQVVWEVSSACEVGCSTLKEVTTKAILQACQGVCRFKL